MLVRDQNFGAPPAPPVADDARFERSARIKEAIFIGIVVSVGTTIAMRFLEGLLGGKK